MATSQNKTGPTDVDPRDYIAAIDHKVRRADAAVLLEMLERITGLPPVMWGPSMIGFGHHHYVYESGREGDMFMTGFAPRKAQQVLYVIAGDRGDYADLLAKLGKHKMSKACLYINKLADVDLAVLEAIIQKGWGHMQDGEVVC